MRHLAGHVGPGFQPLGSLQFGALLFQLGGHPVEVLDEPPQFVGRGRGDARIEIAAGDAPRRPGQAIHRVGDPFRHPVAEACAEQDEQHGGGQDEPIELVGLALAFLALQGLRHRDDPVASAGADRRCRDEIARSVHLLLPTYVGIRSRTMRR